MSMSLFYFYSYLIKNIVFSDHPEDEVPLLDDMSTTVRPTPGFLLTTTTVAPVTQMSQDCVHDDKMFADGALIKTEKACEHCYCMKGDIVCVVQECGAPMENEGKNCTSLPPREGQCCPDTYICEGDELSSDLPTEATTESFIEKLTTLLPPRRTGVEGSGYRNEPDETYTEIPNIDSELEGSGDEEETSKPLEPEEVTAITEDGDQYVPEIKHEQTTTEINKDIIPGEYTEEKTIEPQLYLPTTNAPVKEVEKLTTSGVTEKEHLEPQGYIPTYAPESYEIVTTETSESLNTVPDVIPEEEIAYEYAPSTTSVPKIEDSESPLVQEGQKDKDESSEKDQDVTMSALPGTSKPEYNTPGLTSDVIDKETTTPDEVPIVTSGVTEKEYIETDSGITEPISVTATEKSETLASQDGLQENETYKPALHVPSTTSTPVEEEGKLTTVPDHAQNTVAIAEEEITQPHLHIPTTTIGLPSDEEVTDKVIEDHVHVPLEDVSTATPTFIENVFTTAEPDKGLNTIPIEITEESSSEPSLPEITTLIVETKTTESSLITEEMQTQDVDIKPTIASETATSLLESISTKGDQYTITTEPSFRKEDESSVSTEKPKEFEPTTIKAEFIDEGLIPTSPLDERFGTSSDVPSTDEELTTLIPEYTKDIEETIGSKQTTTESILETSAMIETLPGKDSEHSSQKESESPPSTEKTSDVTAFVPEDIENNELPGRIPGEGDCLLNGVTYRNNTVVPSTNNCHTGCRCASSIIKCDPIICSPPPDYMDNCQSIYDSPDSCCPTYVCDHPRETVPPQSDNQMSGTESPMPSPTIECRGDQCELTEPSQPPTHTGPSDSALCTSGSCTAEADQKPGIECGSEGCGDISQKPDVLLPSTEECTDGRCKPESCSIGECQGQVPPTKPCEGEHCEKVDGVISPPSPQLCQNEEDCKALEIPVIQAIPCEGETCKKIDCGEGDCDSNIISSPQDTEHVPCKEEGGCIPNDTTVQDCTGDEPCRRKEVSTTAEKPLSECEGFNCKPETEKTTAQDFVQLSTEKPTLEQTPSKEVPEKIAGAEDEKATEIPEKPDDMVTVPVTDLQDMDSHTTEGQTDIKISEDDVQKEKPVVIDDEGISKPAVFDEKNKEKPVIVQEEDTEKPAVIEHEETEIPAVIDEKVTDKSVVEGESTDKPIFSGEAGDEKPDFDKEEGTDKPTVIDKEGTVKPTIITEEETDKPTAIEGETEKSVVIEELETEKPSVASDEAEDKPALIEDKFTTKPEVTEEEGTEKPTLIGGEVKEKPTVLDEVDTEKPSLLEKESTEQPDIVQEKDTEKPVMIGEDDKEKPTVLEEVDTDKPDIIEKEGMEEPAIIDEEGKKKPDVDAEVDTDKPTVIEREGTEQPVVIKEESTDKPSMIDEDGKEQPAIIKDQGTEQQILIDEGKEKPALVEKEGTEKPIVETESTEKPADVDEEGTVKPILVDEEIEEKPAEIDGYETEMPNVDEDGKDEPAIIDEEGTETPVEIDDAHKIKPIIIDQEGTEKPAIVEEDGAPKPAETEEKVTDKPVFVDEEGIEHPLESEIEHKEPAATGEVGTEKPPSVDEEGKEKPTIEVEGTEIPAIEIEGTEKHDMVSEDDKKKPEFIEEGTTLKPAMIEREGTEYPDITGDEGTEKPSLIDEEGKDKPNVGDEDTEKPAVIEEEEDVKKPDIINEEGTEKPVDKEGIEKPDMIDEEATKKPTIGETEESMKPAVIEMQSTNKPAIVEDQGTEKPSITDEERTTISSDTELDASEEPAVTETESTGKPAVIKEEGKEKPDMIDEEGTKKPTPDEMDDSKKPAVIEKESTGKPAVTEGEGTERPGVVDDDGIKIPSVVEEPEKEKPTITDKESTQKPDFTKEEGTVIPATTDEEGTENPTVVEEDGKDKQEDIGKPALVEMEGTEKPVVLEEEGKDKPTIIEEDLPEKPSETEKEGVKGPETDEEEGSGTEIPEIHSTEPAKDVTEILEQPTESTMAEFEKVTKSPIEDKHVYSTEFNAEEPIEVSTSKQEIVPSETPETKATEPQDSDIKEPVTLDHSQSPEIATESLTDQEITTKTPLSPTISEEAITAVPDVEKETIAVTEQNLQVTSPKLHTPAIKEESSTVGQDMTIDEATLSTKAPELQQTTELIEKSTKPDSETISEQEEVFTDTPELDSLTTKAPEVGPEILEPQDGTESGKPELPAVTTSETEEESTTKVYEEDKVKPDPQSQITDDTNIQTLIPGYEGTTVIPLQSETPDRTSEIPIITDKEKPESPESHETEPEKIATQLPVDINEEEIKSEHPVAFIPDKEEIGTDTPVDSVTEPVRRFTEIEDSSVTGLEDITTSHPEEATEHHLPSETDKKDESVEKLTPGKEKPIPPELPEDTPKSEKPVEGVPELSTQKPVTEKEKPGVFQSPATEIPMSVVTESQEISYVTEKDITISGEITESTPGLYEQVHKGTILPEAYTEEQEASTEIPQYHITSTEKHHKATESLKEQYVTEIPDTSTKSEEPEVTDTQAITTEITRTSVRDSEAETKAPELMYTETYDLGIKEQSTSEIQKLSTDLPTPSEDVQTEQPSLHVTGEVPQSLVTERQEDIVKTTVSSVPKEGEPQEPELLTTQLQESTKTPDVYISGHEVIRTESPVQITESVEPGTHETEQIITGEEDKMTKVPEEAVTEKQDTLTTLREKPTFTEEVTTTPEVDTKLPEYTTTKQIGEVTKSTEHTSVQTDFSETTPYLIELEEHPHKIETSTLAPFEEEQTVKTLEDISTMSPSEDDHKIVEHLSTVSPLNEERTTIQPGTEQELPVSEFTTKKVSDEEFETATKETEVTSRPSEESSPSDVSEKMPESSIPVKDTTPAAVPDVDNTYDHKEYSTSAPTQISEESTPAVTSEKLPISESDIAVSTETEISGTEKPLHPILSHEVTAPEEEFIFSTTKATTVRQEEEILTPVSDDKYAKPEEKPTETSEVPPPSTTTLGPKPGVSDMQPTDEIPAPDEDGHFPPSGTSGYGEPDYVEEDQAFGPGTCRYGGKVYVSAQQIPRDDPCDFCFCFRSDIICLQQSCPPPIHGCHEEPIQGFCCPRYECPVSMATTVNVTTTTTTTTTTLPPHFPTHSYKGAAQRRGCQIKGHTYKVGEVVRSSSGPCLHCT